MNILQSISLGYKVPDSTIDGRPPVRNVRGHHRLQTVNRRSVLFNTLVPSVLTASC